MRKYKQGEALPDSKCPYCRKRRITRGGGGSACSNARCIAQLNAESVDGGDRGKTAHGETVWVRSAPGHTYKVLDDKDVRGRPCFVLKDKRTGEKITRPIDECEIR